MWLRAVLLGRVLPLGGGGLEKVRPGLWGERRLAEMAGRYAPACRASRRLGYTFRRGSRGCTFHRRRNCADTSGRSLATEAHRTAQCAA